MDKNSVAAGIYAMWQRRLLVNTRERLLPPALRGTNNSLITLKRVIDALHAPDGRFGEHPTRARDALIALSLDEAVAELTEAFRRRHADLAVRPGWLPPRAHPPPAERRRQRRDAREAVGRTPATRAATAPR
jgi:hypothetical protein